MRLQRPKYTKLNLVFLQNVLFWGHHFYFFGGSAFVCGVWRFSEIAEYFKSCGICIWNDDDDWKTVWRESFFGIWLTVSFFWKTGSMCTWEEKVILMEQTPQWLVSWFLGWWGWWESPLWSFKMCPLQDFENGPFLDLWPILDTRTHPAMENFVA